MPAFSSALQEVITRLLAQESKQSRDSEDLTEVAARVYEQFTYRLMPLIGEIGVQAILTRSTNLTRSEFPFLPGNAAMGQGNREPGQIWEAFKQQDPATVRKASEALLLAFAGLLVNLIGERLTWRLLFDLSPEAFSGGPEQERAG